MMLSDRRLRIQPDFAAGNDRFIDRVRWRSQIRHLRFPAYYIFVVRISPRVDETLTSTNFSLVDAATRCLRKLSHPPPAGDTLFHYEAEVAEEDGVVSAHAELRKVRKVEEAVEDVASAPVGGPILERHCQPLSESLLRRDISIASLMLSTKSSTNTTKISTARDRLPYLRWFLHHPVKSPRRRNGIGKIATRQNQKLKQRSVIRCDKYYSLSFKCDFSFRTCA